MNHNQFVTTLEQSKLLLEFGLPASTADMCYIFKDEDGEQCSFDEIEQLREEKVEVECECVSKDADFDHAYEDDCPAWSIGALIQHLPKHLIKPVVPNLAERYTLDIHWVRSADGPTPIVRYVHESFDHGMVYSDKPTLIECLVEMYAYILNCAEADGVCILDDSLK